MVLLSVLLLGRKGELVQGFCFHPCERGHGWVGGWVVALAGERFAVFGFAAFGSSFFGFAFRWCCVWNCHLDAFLEEWLLVEWDGRVAKSGRMGFGGNLNFAALDRDGGLSHVVVSRVVLQCNLFVTLEERYWRVACT